MTAVHSGICRDAGMRARACADRRRRQIWCFRRLTGCGVHTWHAMEYGLGEDGHVTCGWSTNRSACVQHAHGWERLRRAAPARRRRQRCRGLRAAGSPCAGGGYAGKALQKDGKYDSIQSPIVWWTHVCPQVGTGRHARSPAKEKGRVLARLTHDRAPVVHVTLCLCPATLLPGGMALDRCLYRLVYKLCSTRGACSVPPRHATPIS